MLGPLFLQSHVFLCQGKRHWVILDAERDKYHCVNRRQFEALGPLLNGWEGASGVAHHDAAALPADVVALANDLLSLNILSEYAAHAKDAVPTAHRLPTEAADTDSPTFSWWRVCTHAMAFFASAARASRELRGERFATIVEQVRQRKARNAERAGAFDFKRALSLAAIFERLRPFYPHGYDCLPDSLGLIHFLAHFGSFPDWVFGVIADPFEAHCWVQAGSIVLNDRVERVSAFIPIACI